MHAAWQYRLSAQGRTRVWPPRGAPQRRVQRRRKLALRPLSPGRKRERLGRTPALALMRRSHAANAVRFSQQGPLLVLRRSLCWALPRAELAAVEREVLCRTLLRHLLLVVLLAVLGWLSKPPVSRQRIRLQACKCKCTAVEPATPTPHTQHQHRCVQVLHKETVGTGGIRAHDVWASAAAVDCADAGMVAGRVRASEGAPLLVGQAALAGPLAPQMATGRPTPSFGRAT